MSLADDPLHAIPATSRLRRSRSRWRVAAFIAAAIAVVALVARFALPGDQGVGDHIGRVVLNGVITTDADRLAELDDMAEDDSVKAVIVSINSPGGTTAGGEELYEVLGRIREKKPVVAVISELGASAAYMTAIAADEIIARRLSIVGSIGVFYQHFDAGKLMQTVGIDYQKVQSGPLKAEPDINDPLAGPARESLQQLVNSSFDWFVDIVAERRNMERSQVMKLADGRIVTGRTALADGLIDAVGGEKEAVDWLEAERDVATDLPIYTHWPHPESGFEHVARYLGGQAASAITGMTQTPMALDGLVSLWQAAGQS